MAESLVFTVFLDLQDQGVCFLSKYHLLLFLIIINKYFL